MRTFHKKANIDVEQKERIFDIPCTQKINIPLAQYLISKDVRDDHSKNTRNYTIISWSTSVSIFCGKQISGTIR